MRRVQTKTPADVPVETQQAIVRGYTNGTSITVLEMGYSLSRHMVRAILVANGVQIKPKSGANWMRSWS